MGPLTLHGTLASIGETTNVFCAIFSRFGVIFWITNLVDLISPRSSAGLGRFTSLMTWAGHVTVVSRSILVELEPTETVRGILQTSEWETIVLAFLSARRDSHVISVGPLSFHRALGLVAETANILECIISWPEDISGISHLIDLVGPASTTSLSDVSSTVHVTILYCSIPVIGITTEAVP